MPHLDKISQSTAEIKLLPVSENGQPPFWNSISCFYCCLIFVIGVSFCIGLPNFVELPLAELWRHIDFLRWRLAAILNLILIILDHPWSAQSLRLVLKFGRDRIYSFGDIGIFIFRCFGLKLPIRSHIWEFWGHISPKWRQASSSPPKGTSLLGDISFEP